MARCKEGSISDDIVKEKVMDCPKGCGMFVQQQKVFWHIENECVHRTVDCLYCHTTGKHQFIVGQHRDHCPNFPMPCPNRCFSSEMPRGNINEHRKTCLLEKIQCTKCGINFLRKDLKKHMELDCPRRLVCCQYCQREGELYLIGGQHKQYCPKLPLRCPNDCEVRTIAREDIEAHKQICPLEKVYCEYSRVGCKTKIARKDLAEHIKERMEDHLSLTLNECDKIRKEQSIQAAAMDEALQKINDRISMMEIAHQKEINELKTELQSVLGTSYNNWVVKISKEATRVSLGIQAMPVIIRMSGFRIKKDEGPWNSDLFYSHPGGHKLRLTMNVSKSRDWFGGRFSHFSLSLFVIYSMHERQFKRGHMKISLLNQRSDNEHCTSQMNVWLPNLERNMQIGKIDRFISYDDFYRTTNTCQFLQNNNVFIKLQWIQLDQISTV